jgi:hypothetical protein
MAVQRQGLDSTGDHNRVYAADGRLGLGQDWTADWWAALTETPGRDGDAFGWSGRVAYSTRDWNHSLRMLKVGDAFNPEVGFMSRPAGYRFDELQLMRLVRRTTWSRVRQWNPHVTLRRYVGDDGYVQSSQIHLDGTEVTWNSGGRFGPELNIFTEGLQAPFEIASGVTIAPGQYRWAQYGLDWSTNPSAPLSMEARVDVGDFYTGTRNGGNVTFTARKGSSFSSALLFDHQDVHLPEGNFVRELMGVKLAYFFTPHVFVQSLTQYSNQADAFTANLRFAWLNTAGTGLFVVLNDGEAADSFTRWRLPLSRTLTVKYTKQLGRAG